MMTAGLVCALIVCAINAVASLRELTKPRALPVAPQIATGHGLGLFLGAIGTGAVLAVLLSGGRP